jgi:hypothetical protein
MNAYRPVAVATTCCVIGLSLAACTAGITAAGSGTPGSPATSPAASALAATAHTTLAAASPAGAVSVDAPIGSFPVPHGAKVIASTTCDKQVVIELGSVTPKQASTFYLLALPRAGYRITGNTLVDSNGDGLPGAAAEIDFTGHGYKGQISAVADMGALASTGPSPVSVPSNMAKNFSTITLTPPGTAGCGT